ncbi:MAG: DsbC family protein [Zoogloeaceae bacterium]|nr:DsbC family protein [Zoogloeaceae bacterium]
MKSPIAALALTLSLLAPTAIVHADEAIPEATAQELRAALARLLPDRQVDRIRTTPIAGLYEVTNGGRVYYITGDGNHLITGHLIDTRVQEDLSAGPIQQAKADLLAAFGNDMTINYGGADLPYEVVVFTDIDCGYCRQLHQQIAAYNDAGIRVRYFLYPRAGLNSESYVKARNAWCADDPAAALTAAKANQPLDTKVCDDPIAAHMELGEELGVNGTPTIFTTDAIPIPGFARAPERMVAVLKQLATEKAAQ